MSGKKVAILGAGMSGLTAIKSCLEEGLEPTCFEQLDSVGGLWYYTEDYREDQGPRAFDSLTTNISKSFFAYSDFPHSRERSPFLTHKDVHAYLRNYCQSFGLEKYIKFRTKVKKIRKALQFDVTGTWEVQTESNGTERRQEFHSVMICSGFNQKPLVPKVQGMETFQGEIQHSARYINGQRYKQQRVVVVGNGNSSGDIAAGVAVFAEKVFYSVGDGMWVWPRCTEHGVPFDFKFLTRAAFKSSTTLDATTYTLCTSRMSLKHSGLCPSLPPSKSKIIINDEVQNYIMNGKIQIHGRLVRLGPREAEFDDGSVVHDLDAVLFATGYRFSLEFLEEKIIDDDGKLSLYKMIFPLQLKHHTLALIGCGVFNGPHPPVVELQSRIAARVFSGQHALPSRLLMKLEIDERNKRIYHTFGRYKYMMSYMPLHDELAKELGVVPSWLDLIKAGPRVAYNYLYGPAFPFQDRLWGPHPWPGAKEAIYEALEHGYYTKQPRLSNPPRLRRRSKLCRGILFCVLLSFAILIKYLNIIL